MNNFVVELHEVEVEPGVRYGLVYDPIDNISGMEKRCGCGCGETTKVCRGKLNNYIKNHNKRGIPSWRKGKKLSSTNPVSVETRKKMSESLKKVIHTEEWNKKVSEANKGKIPWMKGKHHTEESIRKCRESHLGKKYTIETRMKHKEIQTKLWKDPEFREKVKAGWNLKPNYPEYCLIHIFNYNNLDYKYTGDLSFWMSGNENEGSKNPDFTHITEKRVVEFFGRIFHRPEEEQEAVDFYKRHGYECVVIWWDDLKDSEVLSKKLGVHIELPPRIPKLRIEIEKIDLI